MMITQYYPNPLFRKTGARHGQSGNGSMGYEAESVWNRVKTLYEAGEIPSPCVSWDWMPLTRD